MPGTIVTTSGGCAAHLASVLGRERVQEFSQVVTAEQPVLRRLLVDGRPARLTLQDSCHLRNGLDVHAEPRAVLRRLGDYVELPGASGCCGAAGSYALVRPTDSRRVLDPKLDAIEALGVDAVAVVNPGCYRQVQQGLRRRRSRVRVLHLAELVHIATTGSDPRSPLRRGTRFACA